LLLGVSFVFFTRAAPRPRNRFEAAFAAEKERKKMAIPVSSNAFSEGQPIPENYTRHGRTFLRR
jgi:phosphatidylethanolamine-binding protein (PEBP) family uncharacterized protein